MVRNALRFNDLNLKLLGISGLDLPVFCLGLLAFVMIVD